MATRKVIFSYFIFLFMFSAFILMAYPQEKPVLIQNARILLPDHDFHESIDVFIKNGIIHFVGQSLKVPEQAEIIDASGKWMIPGLMDIFIYPSKVPEKNPKMSDYFTPDEMILDTVNPAKYPYRSREVYEIFKLHKEKFQDALKSGITTLFVIPGDEKIVGGLAGVFKPKHLFMEGNILSDRCGLKIGFSRKKVQGLMSHMSIVWKIRELFLTEQNKLNESGNPGMEKPFFIFSDVFSRQMPVLFEVNTEEEAARALSLVKEFGLRAVFFGNLDAPFSYPAIAKENIPVILKCPDDENWDRFTRNFVLMKKTGLKSSIYSGNNNLKLLKLLPILHLWFSKAGISDRVWLESIFINFAEILGLSSRLGSIEAGKDADLVLLGDNPLKPLSNVEMVMVDGESVSIPNISF